MKIYSHNITSVIKSIQGKKFLAECKPHHFNDKPLKLLPITDIDDEFVSYSIGKSGESITFPTDISDVFEQMSFEKAANKNYPDIFRKNELYRRSTDYRPDAGLVLDTDDVPISPTILKEIHHHSQLSKVYYPDTDLNYNSQIILKHMDFIEHIIPSAFDSKLHVEKNAIKQYADIATRAWEKDMPTTEIIKLIKKSIVNGNNIAPTYPSTTLFEFLTKYPNERNMVVFSSKNGVEHIDNKAIKAYDKFATKHFKDKKIIHKILDECKTKQEYPIKTVDSRLCEIATLTRKKSAHGMEMPNTQYIYLDGTIPSIYCEKNTPWRECDSQLIASLKKDGHVDEDKFEIAKHLLKEMNKPVDYVLKNIEILSDKYKHINEIKTTLENTWLYSYDKDREEIIQHLDTQLKRLLKEEPNSFNVDINIAKKLIEKKIAPTQISKVLKTLSMEFNGDEATLNKIINAILVPANRKGTRLVIDDYALNLVSRLVYRDRALGEKGLELLNLISTSKASERNEIISRIDMLLDEINYKDITSGMVKKSMSKAPEKVSHNQTKEITTTPRKLTKEQAIKIKQRLIRIQKLKQEGKLPEGDGNIDFDDAFAELDKYIKD